MKTLLKLTIFLILNSSVAYAYSYDSEDILNQSRNAFSHNIKLNSGSQFVDFPSATILRELCGVTVVNGHGCSYITIVTQEYEVSPTSNGEVTTLGSTGTAVALVTVYKPETNAAIKSLPKVEILSNSWIQAILNGK